MNKLDCTQHNLNYYLLMIEEKFKQIEQLIVFFNLLLYLT